MDHALRKHAKYGGSVIYRVILCPGSVALAERAPYTPPSRWALDGTDAHELLDYALKNGYWDAREASIMANRIEKDTHPDAGERLDAVQVALDYVANILEMYEDAVLYVEHPFQFPTTIDPDNAFGTCDVCIHVPSLSLIYIIDYKHGVKAVEHEENKQGLYYATGAVIGSGHLEAETIIITIIQPRSFHPKGRVREHPVDRSRLVTFVDEVDNAILASLDPTAPLVPGDVQCEYCPARLTCPAREAMAVQTLGANFRSVKEITQLPVAALLPIDRLLYIEQSKDMLLKFLADVDAALYAHAMGGGVVPGKKIVEAQARRKWHGDPQQVAEALARLAEVPVDDVYPRQLINITEADALVAKAFKDKAPRGKKKQAAEEATLALAALTLKQSSGNLVLVDNTDTRQAVNRTAVAFASVVAIQNMANMNPDDLSQFQ